MNGASKAIKVDIGKLRRSAQRTVLFDVYSRVAQQRMRFTGSAERLPPHLKHQLLLEYATSHKLHVLVETGTYLGTTIRRVRAQFDRVVSIELDETLADEATRYFAGDSRVTIVQGDSAQALPAILDSLNQPALFWLDAHFSGGFTARAEVDTPIVRELQAVLGHHVKGHVVLVDDIREFGTAGYPDVAWLEAFIRARRPEMGVSVADDIMRVAPIA